MKPGALLLTVLLVAAGLWAYDRIASDRGASDRPPSPLLGAPGSDLDPDVLARFEEYLEAAEAEGHAPQPSAPLGAPGSALDPALLARFREILDAAEAQRLDERLDAMIQGQFDRLDVNLPEEQRTRAVKAAAAFRRRVRETLQQHAGGSDASLRERLDALAALRVEFARAIEQIAPPSEAQKIVEGVGRYPGMPDPGGAATAEGVEAQLGRASVSLTEEQRTRVVKAAVAHRERVETLQSASDGSEASRLRRREAMAALRDELLREIQQIAPSEAEKIVEALASE
jgi:hypothetical protein